MRTFIYIIFLSTQPQISWANNDYADIFTPHTRAKILAAIDSICADTWCEGDYDFTFNEFKCQKSKQRCELNFQFIRIEDDYKKIYSPVQICSFDNIRKVGQILTDDNQLNRDFYEQLTDCIHEKERQVRF